MTLSSKIHVWTAVVTTNTQAVFPVWRLYYLLCRTILELIWHCKIYALIRLTKPVRAQHDTVSISKRHSAPLTFEDRVQESTSTPDCFNFDRRFSCAMWSAWYSMSYCRTSKVTRYGALNIEENIRGIVRQTFGIHCFPPPLPLPPPLAPPTQAVFIQDTAQHTVTQSPFEKVQCSVISAPFLVAKPRNVSPPQNVAYGKPCAQARLLYVVRML